MGSQKSQTWLSDWAHRQHEIIWFTCLECRQHGSTAAPDLGLQVGEAWTELLSSCLTQEPQFSPLRQWQTFRVLPEWPLRVNPLHCVKIRIKLELKFTFHLFVMRLLNMDLKVQKAYVQLSATNLLSTKRTFWHCYLGCWGDSWSLEVSLEYGMRLVPKFPRFAQSPVGLEHGLRGEGHGWLKHLPSHAFKALTTSLYQNLSGLVGFLKIKSKMQKGFCIEMLTFTHT